MQPILEKTKRLGYSPSEFARACGKHPSWAYRALYQNKLRAITALGRILIPVSEVERVMATAAPYNPKRNPKAEKVEGTDELS